MNTSIGENILTQIGSDLVKLTVANGYNTTLVDIFEGFISIEGVNNFPSAYYELGTEAIAVIGEGKHGKNLLSCELEAVIGLSLIHI